MRVLASLDWREVCKWIVSALAVITLPVWFLPLMLVIVIGQSVKSFKEDVLDE